MEGVWPLSITVSTTGFHPVNAGSTPAEVTKTENGQSARVALWALRYDSRRGHQSFTMWFYGGPVAQLVRARAF